MLDVTPTGLRVLREVAERGSFTAAARALGYTQSAVSRQIAALERAAGHELFRRGRAGAELTPAGTRLLSRAARILEELDAAQAELSGAAHGRVRLGAFAVAAANLVPSALVRIAQRHPELLVTLREAPTPALVRAIRAGTLDLAVIAQSPPFRPPDAGSPPLRVTTLFERELVIGVGPDHPFARRRAVEVEELAGQVWVASRGEGGESLLGVWPGLAERPEVRYVVRDWLAKFRLVGAGLGITTVAPAQHDAAPAGVRLIAVRGEPQETRRVSAVRMPGTDATAVIAVEDALKEPIAG